MKSKIEGVVDVGANARVDKIIFSPSTLGISKQPSLHEIGSLCHTNPLIAQNFFEVKVKLRSNIVIQNNNGKK